MSALRLPSDRPPPRHARGLQAAAAELGAERAFVSRAFKACDVLRARLRAEGTTLTDLQTEGAYRSRVSHLAAAGDYMLSPESLQKLQAAFGVLTVDAFASGATAQLPRFWAAEAVDGAEGTDAFRQVALERWLMMADGRWPMMADDGR